MKICHISPFAPNRCGLYEASRDMARADILGGHEVIFVDAGVSVNGQREEPQIGAIDDRGDFRLVTVTPNMIDEADIIMMHTGCHDGWIVKNQTPLIWAVHGRPLACFRPEINGNGHSYSMYANLSAWKRTKKMLYFWDEFRSHWTPIFNGKDAVLSYPVIDEKRFNEHGKKFEFSEKGLYNILVCDSHREDIDIYEMTVGLLQTCKKIKGIKVHFFGMEFPLHNAYNILLGKLKEIGSLGDIAGRIANIDEVYRASDCLISPNRIITRTIGEALSCKIPVIAQNPCKIADYTCDMAIPNDVERAITEFCYDFEEGKISKEKLNEKAKLLSLKNYATEMNKIYREVLI